MNSKDARTEKSRARRSRLTRQLLIQYVMTVVAFVSVFVILFFAARWIAGRITWSAGDPLYRLLKWMQEYVQLWGGAIVLAGWAFITYRYISKPLRYLDEIVAASEQLASPDERPIVLPGAIKNIQDELNLVREQALRNSMAAREAEQRKNDLVVYLAHDLKTPLTSVIGYLTLLRDEPGLSPELRARYTGVALNKSERLEYLINEFFEITRFNLTHLVLEPERVNLTRMLEQIAFEFNPLLSEKELNWSIELTPNVEITCDPDKLERVFDNLIRNAVNYSYSGTAIQLSLEAGEAYAVIRIRNHGKTIPRDKLNRIFEQFFRLDSSRASATGGVGLGLAIAKEIVALHGGEIEAESENECISFSVKLPLNCQKIFRN